MKNQRTPLQVQMHTAIVARITTITSNGITTTTANLVAPLPVVMLDRRIHTKRRPYCNDDTCPCHTDRYQG